MGTLLVERGRTLQTTLVGCAVFACVAVGALFSVNVAYEHNTAIDVAQRAGSNLAQSLARQASDAFSATDCALIGLAERVQAERHDSDGNVAPAGRERLRTWMAMQVAMVPRIHGLEVVDAAGRSAVSDRFVATGPRRYVPEVAYLRAHPEVATYISEDSNGKNGLTILVSRPVARVDGSFGGAVIAKIEVGYFEQIFKSVDVGRLGTIALISDDGTALVRVPTSFGSRLRDLPHARSPVKPEFKKSYVTNSDGVRRMVSYRQLDDYPLAIDVGLAESEYLAGWRAAAVVNSLALALVVVTIGVLAAGLRLQMRRRSAAEGRLAELALLDGLTGLANRRQFDVVLEREWRRAGRDGSPLALLMIDVDHFKAYNDRYGHVRGDSALIMIARALATNVLRTGDLAARYGGEEFAVILPSTDKENALAIGERIREAIVALDIPHADASGFIVTASVGVAALAPSSTAPLSVLVQIADNALYDAKRGGRNRTAVMRDGSDLKEFAVR